MRLLVIAPHADDEVLGCGGTVARRAAEGWEVHVVVAALPQRTDAERTLRQSELEAAAAILGVARTSVLLEADDPDLDRIPRRELVARLDRHVTSVPYEQVLFPYPSHHQDHRLLSEASFSALRPRPALASLHVAAMYEYPYVGWDLEAPSPGGRWYVDIAETLERKLEALAVYRSQARGEEHPISATGVRTLAAKRGLECGRAHAEMFRIARWVE